MHASSSFDVFVHRFYGQICRPALDVIASCPLLTTISSQTRFPRGRARLIPSQARREQQIQLSCRRMNGSGMHAFMILSLPLFVVTANFARLRAVDVRCAEKAALDKSEATSLSHCKS